MKGKTARKDGGVVDKDPAPSETYAGKGSNVEKEAKERKAGGRIARKAGGHIHHEKMENMKHAHHVGMVHGEAKHHAGRKPRKSGGSCESNLFSAAAKGERPKGHSTEKDMG